MDRVQRDTNLSISLELYGKKLSDVSAKRVVNHYDYLELEPSCTVADIRRAYYHFSLMCHPDKCHNKDAQTLLYNIQQAYDVLSDDYKRVHYDIQNGFRSAHELTKQLHGLRETMEEKYNNFLIDRKEAYIRSLRNEHERGGLVIKKAFYGDLSLMNPSIVSSNVTIQEKDLKGPYIDVTVQLQVLIEHGVLHINSGRSMSYAFLPGFYNPTDFTAESYDSGYEGETHLYILYLFKGDVHEVTAVDGVLLKLPMKSHRVYGSYIKGPYAIADI